jgi:hypothetical protein
MLRQVGKHYQSGSLFHSLTVEGINDELVIESLQKGTIKLSPFRKGYIVVL